MNVPTFIFDVDYTLYNSKDIPERENDTEDITELFYSLLSPKKKLYEMLEQYKGKKYLFSNGNFVHVDEVIRKIGLGPLFPTDSIATLDDYMNRPKPYVQSYMFVIHKFNLKPNDLIYFFEDNLDNLKVAKQRYNWKTIYIDEDKTTNKKLSHYKYVDYTFKHINKALQYLLPKISKQQTKQQSKNDNVEKKITQRIKRRSPKISPRRNRTSRKKIDNFTPPRMSTNNQRIKKSVNRLQTHSPITQKKNSANNYMNSNRLYRMERLHA